MYCMRMIISYHKRRINVVLIAAEGGALRSLTEMGAMLTMLTTGVNKLDVKAEGEGGNGNQDNQGNKKRSLPTR